MFEINQGSLGKATKTSACKLDQKYTINAWIGYIERKLMSIHPEAQYYIINTNKVIRFKILDNNYYI